MIGKTKISLELHYMLVDDNHFKQYACDYHISPSAHGHGSEQIYTVNINFSQERQTPLNQANQHELA